MFIGCNITKQRMSERVNEIVPEINCIHTENLCFFLLAFMWLAHATNFPLTMAESSHGCLGTDFIKVSSIQFHSPADIRRTELGYQKTESFSPYRSYTAQYGFTWIKFCFAQTRRQERIDTHLFSSVTSIRVSLSKVFFRLMMWWYSWMSKTWKLQWKK